ncbi:MAG: iron complex outermembrane receptor protein, partial [Candidatus Azotimanducaceae bacterium]
MSKRLSSLSLLPMVAAVAFSNQVHAQRTATTQIEEIVVTAQKREENIQDVPISISAIDAKTIERTFARSIDEITGMSPNLVINPVLGNGTAAISIRGMQFAEVEK